MDFINDLFFTQSAIQAIVIIASICAIGQVFGKFKVGGISLGVTFVFFVGIIVGNFGFSINQEVLTFIQTFGLVIFVYALGLQVGPGFFSSFGNKTIKLNIIGLFLILLGTSFTILISKISGISLPNMMGVLSGATTNTPALGAAQQTLNQMGLGDLQNSVALACAVSYPLGVVGVIFVIVLLRKFVSEERLEPPKTKSPENTFIATFIVLNEEIIGKPIIDVAQMSHKHFVISRLWRHGQVSIPVSATTLQKGDRILVITTLKDIQFLMTFFGEQETRDWNSETIDWNAIDSQLTSRGIIITKPEINGKKIGSLRIRNKYGVNISRVYRSGIPLLATPDLVLQMGDRLVVIGEKDSIKNVEAIIGNAEQKLNDPNLAPIFIGIMLGVILGTIPLFIPGMSTPVKLGMAGGPIIMGMIIGTFGPRVHMITYTTRSANLMLRGLGLSLFLACIGLDSGSDFFSIVFQPEGVLWVVAGLIITTLPVALTGLICYYFLKLDFGTICGLLCGSMANPMALNYANDTIPGDAPSIAYATVYPLGMFSRVILAQVVLLLLI